MSIIFRWASLDSIQNKQSIRITKSDGTKLILKVGRLF